MGERKLDEALKAAASRHMFEFKLESFKVDHPRLYRTIKDAMVTYAIECIDFVENKKVE